MCLFQYDDDDPEPEEQAPAGPLYVPVAAPGTARVVVRLFRSPSARGHRTGRRTDCRTDRLKGITP